MDLGSLLSADLTKTISLIAWAVCLLWAASQRRWRMTCAFGCLAAAAVLRHPGGPASDKIIVVGLTVFAVMLLMSDIRAHAARRRVRDTSKD